MHKSLVSCFFDSRCRLVPVGLHTEVTFLLLSWTAFTVDVNSKPKNCSVGSSISRNTAYISCYLLQENSLVTDRLRFANKLPRIFAKTNRFKNSCICYSLNSLQCEWYFYYLSDCVIKPSSCHITMNRLTAWLIDSSQRVLNSEQKSSVTCRELSP